ncbi:MAG: NAD(P)/FAD-dependent oxidoreductase [Saprospiraceae bacterium]|nr:NAD(P)/FAD-dependent oxidoreductase [Saprospiraceae bacterium]
MVKTLIIGNGVAGISCARSLRRFTDDPIAIISDESDFFFSRTALMYVYMGHMRWQDLEPYERKYWQKNKLDLIRAKIVSFDFQNRQVISEDGNKYGYDRLVLALGSVPNKFGWPGEELDGVSGFYSKQDLERIEEKSSLIKRAVIVGGGLIGIELAEMFHSRNIPVTMLVRESEYWSSVLPNDEAAMISAHIRNRKIDLRLETKLKSIRGEDGKVKSIVLDAGEELECDFVGITAGVRPHIDLLKGTPLSTDRGILVNEFLETNIPEVYAIGDCAQLTSVRIDRKAVEAIWYSARKMGNALAANLAGIKTPYDPGIWFNSAKFFDLEYQVYGTVPNKIEFPLDSIFWKAPQDEKSIRLVYDTTTNEIAGFNLLGVRFRQEVCHKWISGKSKISDVLSDIRLAFFDPEFFPDYAPELLESFKQKTGHNIQLRSSGKLNSILQFLKS